MQNKKKRILILVDWFAPGFKAGGPIQSCVNIAFALKDTYEIYVLTTDTDHGEKQPYEGIPSNQWITNIDPQINIYYAKKASLSITQLSREIEKVNADFVYLNHLFSPYFVVYPLWLKYTGKIRNKMIVCPRGALYDSALSVKPYKKKPFLLVFRKMSIHKRVIFHATNQREKEAIENYFPGSKICIADNLPNINQPEFVSCPKERGMLKCVFIARLVPIKNLLYLLHALTGINSRLQLTVIGPIENEGYWEECKKKIAQLPPGIRVNYEGTKPNHELVNIIRQHHLFVLPTTGENFGHSIFEAMLAGRPVLISDQTPWLNLNSKKAGWDLPLDVPVAFVKALENAASWNQQDFEEFARSAWQYARNFISNPSLKEQYKKLFA